MDDNAARAADEGRHQASGEPLWNESIYLDFFAADGSLGGYVRMGLYPNMGVAWYWACLVGEGRPLVTVIDHEAPLPPAPGLELRASGLWSEIIVETPLEHATVGLEAFGVTLDDPADVYGDGRGHPTPLGLDLEWETDGGSFAYDVTTRYEVPCRVHGEILVGDESFDLDGWGQRDHSWGVRDWWSLGWCWAAGRLDDGTRFHVTTTGLGWSTGYVSEPGSGSLRRIDGAAVETNDGPHGIPTAGRLVFDGLEVDIEPIAWAPVRIDGPDGQVSRFPRALARFAEPGGRSGHGWIEFNQPQP